MLGALALFAQASGTPPVVRVEIGMPMGGGVLLAGGTLASAVAPQLAYQNCSA
jgi:hypothetical protein